VFEQYHHHDDIVWVRSDLKGKHREHCLCHSCTRFKPEHREMNCSTANLVYSVCCECGLVLPVWECPYFEERDACETES